MFKVCVNKKSAGQHLLSSNPSDTWLGLNDEDDEGTFVWYSYSVGWNGWKSISGNNGGKDCVHYKLNNRAFHAKVCNSDQYDIVCQTPGKT